MMITVLFLITTYLAFSMSEINQKLIPAQLDCNNIVLPIEYYSQTVFFDMDVHGQPDLKTCILKNNLSGLTRILIGVYGTKIDIRVNVTRNFIKTSDNPNVIIMTKYLTPKMMDSSLWKFFFRSRWSILYIVMTGDKFKCENGTMDTSNLALLERMMNVLWHRFQIMRVAILFPFTCEQKILLYHGKRPSSNSLYDRSVKLFNNSNPHDTYLAIRKSGKKLADDYPMRGSIFYRYPTSIKDCKNMRYYDSYYNLKLTGGYCGVDGMVMHDILSHLKFNLTMPENENCDNYGYAAPGNVSGVLGCIIRDEVDISFNSRFLTLYSDEHLYYLHFVKTEKLCVLIRKTDIIPIWQGVFDMLTPELWALTGMVLVAIACILWATALVNKTLSGSETETFWSYLYTSVLSTMIGYSPMSTKSFLMIRSACLMGSILILALYQGHMSRVFTTVKHFRQIRTLRDLYGSSITLYTSPSMKQFMKQLQNPEDRLQKEFFDRVFVTVNGQIGKYLPNSTLLHRRDLATIDRKSDALMQIMKNYTDRFGTPKIDIVDECFYTYYLSYVARSDFPFFEDVQYFTERLQEAGLPTMYYKWTQQMLNIPRLVTDDNRSLPRPLFKIRLRDECVAFAILFFGSLCSLVIFAAEIWKGKRRNKESRMTDFK
ncbi:unnamed protein product [Spodoptera exigua]|nr:unnamed protein product [Spodoptera exigua]